MAITDSNSYALAKARASAKTINKASVANAAAGTQFSLWRATGIPAQAAIPGAAAIPDRNTSGAIPLGTLLGGTDTRYVDAWNLASSVANVIHVVDRLCHSGNLNGTLTTAQTVSTPALPGARVGAGAAGVEWYLEWYTDTGATAVTATVNVTYDDLSTGNLAAISLAATRRAGFMAPLLPAVAGRYITGVNSVTLSATTGAVGAFGVTALQRLGVAGLVSVANNGDRAEALLRPIPTDACLALYVDCSTTSTGAVLGAIVTLDG